MGERGVSGVGAVDDLRERQTDWLGALDAVPALCEESRVPANVEREMPSVQSGTGPRRRSPKVTAAMADEMRRLRSLGMMQHDIAAHFGVNQGRVSEVLSGKPLPAVARNMLD